MHDSQKFSDVVCSDGRLIVKESFSGEDIYALIFHYARIAAAGCIYG